MGLTKRFFRQELYAAKKPNVSNLVANPQLFHWYTWKDFIFKIVECLISAITYAWTGNSRLIIKINKLRLLSRANDSTIYVFTINYIRLYSYKPKKRNKYYFLKQAKPPGELIHHQSLFKYFWRKLITHIIWCGWLFHNKQIVFLFK